MKRRQTPHQPDPNQRIIIRSERKDPIDIDLLVEAILLITEQQLLQQEAEDFARSLAKPATPQSRPLSEDQTDQDQGVRG